MLRALLLLGAPCCLRCSTEAADSVSRRFLSAYFQNSNDSNFSTQLVTIVTSTSTAISDGCACICNTSSDFTETSTTSTSSTTTLAITTTSHPVTVADANFSNTSESITSATTSTSLTSTTTTNTSSFFASSDANSSNDTELSRRLLDSTPAQGSCPECVCNATVTLESTTTTSTTSTGTKHCMPPTGYASTALGCAGSLTNHGENCTLNCDPGWTKSGEFFCFNGNWQLPLPTCTPSPCNYAPVFPNNATARNYRIDPCIGTLHGHECILTCKTGFTKSGNFKCNHGVFDSPSCIPPCVTQPNVPVLPEPDCEANVTCVNTQPEVDCSLPVTHGGQCLLECPPGYSKTGDFICDKGTFSSARCEPDCTEPPPRLSNAYWPGVPCSLPAKKGDTCELKCLVGFTKSGDFVCSGGSWTSTGVRCFPTTTATTTRPPVAPPPKLASIEFTNEYQELVVLTFDCRVRVCVAHPKIVDEVTKVAHIQSLCRQQPFGCEDLLTDSTVSILGSGAVCSMYEANNRSVINIVLGSGSNVLPGDDITTRPNVLFRNVWAIAPSGAMWEGAQALTAKVPADAPGMPTAKISVTTPVSGPCSTVTFSSKASSGGRLDTKWAFGPKTPLAIRSQLQATLKAANSGQSVTVSFPPEEFHAAVKALKAQYKNTSKDFKESNDVLQVQVTVYNRNGETDSASAEVPIPIDELSRLGQFCECAPGFFGADCSGKCVCEADGTASCDDGRTGTGACTCEPGFGGPTCDEKLSWQTGSWSECGPCSSSKGSQSRQVRCEWSSGKSLDSDKWSCVGEEPHTTRSCVPPPCPCTKNPPEVPNGDVVRSGSVCAGTESGADCVGVCKVGFNIYGAYKCSQGRWVSWPRCIEDGVAVKTMAAFRSAVAFGGLDGSLLRDVDTWAESAGPAFRTVVSNWVRGMSGPQVTEEDVVIEKVQKLTVGGRRMLQSLVTVQIDFVVLLRNMTAASSKFVEERLLQVLDHGVPFVAAMREELSARCASCAQPSSVAMEAPLLTEVTLAAEDLERKPTSPPVQNVAESSEDSSSTDDVVPIVGLCAGLTCSCLLLGCVLWRRRRADGETTPGWANWHSQYRTKTAEDVPVPLDHPQKSVATIIVRLADELVSDGPLALPPRHAQTTIARLRAPLSQRLARHLGLEQDDVEVVGLEVAAPCLRVEVHCTARTEAAASRTHNELRRASRRFWLGHHRSLAGLEGCVRNAAEKVRLDLMTDVKISVNFQGTQGGARHPSISNYLKHLMASISSKLSKAKASLRAPSPPTQLRVPGLGVASSSRQGKWGTTQMADGSEYQGELEWGVRQGLGRQVSADGTVYIGSFKDDLPHGDGSIQWANGHTYAGQWVKGRVEGHGLLQAGDDWIYNGQFRDNLRHGIGRCEWVRSSQWYEGDWKDGVEDGVGEAGKDDAMASASGNCPQTAQLWSWASGVREATLLTVSVAPGPDEKLLHVALGEAVIDPHGWLAAAQDAREAEGGDSFGGYEEVAPDDRNSGQWEVAEWGFSIGHPNLWLPGRWGALVLTRIAEDGRLAQFNRSAKEVQKSAEVVETNAIIWAVDGFSGDANRMASMLLDRKRRGVVLELKNPSSSSCPTIRANLQKRSGWWNSSQHAVEGRHPWKVDAPPPPPMPPGARSGRR